LAEGWIRDRRIQFNIAAAARRGVFAAKMLIAAQIADFQA
jgi:hypothetical protein